jgi:hypothetical protein
MALYKTKGSEICHLRMMKDVPKGDLRHVYGVLLHNTEMNSICGTCVMENGEWLTLSWRMLKKGLSRIHEDNYKISMEKRQVCEALYLADQSDEIALLARIKQCEAVYLKAEADAAQQRRAKRNRGTVIMGTQDDMQDDGTPNVPATNMAGNSTKDDTYAANRNKTTNEVLQEGLEVLATTPKEGIATEGPCMLTTTTPAATCSVTQQESVVSEVLQIAPPPTCCEKNKNNLASKGSGITCTTDALATITETQQVSDGTEGSGVSSTIPQPPTCLESKQDSVASESSSMTIKTAAPATSGETHKGSDDTNGLGALTTPQPSTYIGSQTAAPDTCSDTQKDGRHPEGSGISPQDNMAVPPANLQKQKANEQSLLVLPPRRSLLNLNANILLRNGKPVNGAPRTIHEIHDAEAQTLLPAHLVLHPIPRDGNCLFHALLACCGRTDMSHWDLRKQIVEHVISMWNDTQVTYATWIRFDYPSETPDTYRDRLLGRTKDWGDFAEIVAASTVLDTDIEIHAFKPGCLTLDTTPISTNDAGINTNEKIHLLRVNHSHYHALIPTSTVLNEDPAPPNTPPLQSLPESDSEVRTRLAAFINALPGAAMCKDRLEQQTSLKRKWDEDLRLKQTLDEDHKNVDDDDDFESGNQGCGKEEGSSKEEQPNVTKQEANPNIAVKVKRDRTVRSQDRSNRSEKNWTTAMKRHWHTKQKDLAIALITIKRDKLQEVQLHIKCS